MQRRPPEHQGYGPRPEPSPGGAIQEQMLPIIKKIKQLVDAGQIDTEQARAFLERILGKGPTSPNPNAPGRLPQDPSRIFR